jgi:transposase
VLDPFDPYLLTRWREGCQNATWLFGEIQAQGYQGSLSLLRLYCAHLRQHPEQANAARPRKQRAISASPRELRWRLGCRPEDLDAEEQERLSRLLTVSAEVRTIYVLLQTFLELVRQRQHEQLRPWMEEAAQSGIAEMKSFVAGIEQDFEAVEAALRFPWSQGQTEGQGNKLKTLKRQMYGRAGFALLRVRMLYRD